jgi:hypothetical protein
MFINSTKPARERFPLGAVIMAGLWAIMMIAGGIWLAWSEGWPILGTASQIIATPIGAFLMYRVMARIAILHDATRAGQSQQNPQAFRRLLLGVGIGVPVAVLVMVQLNLLHAALGFAGGGMVGLFWWMVRQRSAQ